MNFLPPELRPGPRVDRWRLAVISLITLTAGLCLIGALSQAWQVFVARNEILRARAELAALQDFSNQMRSLRAERERMEKTAEALQRLKGQVRPWKQLLNDLNNDVPVDLWLTGVELTYNKELDKISGGQKASPEAAVVPGPGTRDAGDEEGSLPPPPNELLIRGVSRSVPSIGVLVRNLRDDRGVTEVSLKEMQEQQDGTLLFIVSCRLAGGASDVGAAQ